MVKKIKLILSTVLLIVIGAVGYYGYSFYSFANKIQASPESSKFGLKAAANDEEIALAPPKWEGKERVSVLLLGGDSRTSKANEIPRSDTLMVASLDPVTKKAYLFSILRDTYVKIPGKGSDRINTAVSTGGPHLAMKTASDLLGIPIQYYVYTDFQGFMALVDAIGGIELEVEKDMHYKDNADQNRFDINLKKGFQHLDGEHALQYVRFRHDALSDYTRTERQRKFMQAVATKMQKTSAMLRIPKILNSIDPYIETNLPATDMLKLAMLGYEAQMDGMVSEQIPPSKLLVEKRIGGASVLSANTKKVQAYVEALLNDQEEASTGSAQTDERSTAKK